MIWEPGDEAYCIKRSPWKQKYSDGEYRINTGKMPVFGMTYTVRDVGIDDEDDIILWLVGYPGDKIANAFTANAFIKITPLKEEDEDAEIIDIMKGKEHVV